MTDKISQPPRLYDTPEEAAANFAALKRGAAYHKAARETLDTLDRMRATIEAQLKANPEPTREDVAQIQMVRYHAVEAEQALDGQGWD